jgi:hypothetical protein
MNFPIPEFVIERLNSDAEFLKTATETKAKYDSSIYAERFPRSLNDVAYQLLIEERANAITARMKKEAESYKLFQQYLEQQKEREKELLKFKKGLRIGIGIQRMQGNKCPRCYMYWGVKENFMELCDRCCTQLLDGADTLVEMGRLTVEERDILVNGIKEAQLPQVDRYRIKDEQTK